METELYKIKLYKAYLFWLLSLLLVAYLSQFLVSFYPEINNKNNPALFRWDSAWYISIADGGYHFDKVNNSNIAFFPLYPILIKITDAVLNIGLNWSGQILSIIFSFFLVKYFYKLMVLDYPPRESFYIVSAFLFFPSSFFLISVYTESLFVLLVVLSFYSARNERWFLAGLFSSLAAITKPYGILVMPLLFVEYLLMHGSSMKIFFHKKKLAVYHHARFSRFWISTF